jgi:hypothetical protein
MLHKLIVGVMLLMLSLLVQPATGAEKGDAKAGEKVSATSNKCWQRMEAYKDDGGSYVRGDLPVCKAFEEVLNTTCEPPEKLECNWTLPEGEKMFQKLKWKTVNWREYWDIIGYLSVSLIFPTGEREERWKLMKERVREDFEKDISNLSITTVDINNDGIEETVARIDFFSIPCNKKIGSIYGVVDIVNKEVMPYRGLFFDVNINRSPEIIYYDGKAFMFSLYRFARNVMIYEGSPLGERYGSQNICQFRYIKGGK